MASVTGLVDSSRNARTPALTREMRNAELHRFYRVSLSRQRPVAVADDATTYAYYRRRKSMVNVVSIIVAKMIPSAAFAR